ncbi:hypothetical protein RHGRI_012564 [Rhododendron griersonianum]|uniref:Pantoate--beta-alanine ligase n=1 Tax=Rhododendron griersonianum TaxID=479676 RepID=A0AAV6KS70_9ERIC|nr:hypothetical protein RHGRI_012564 [Rhododendron griersonianum]
MFSSTELCFELFFSLRCAELMGPTLNCGWGVAKSCCVPSIYGKSCLRWKLKKSCWRATSHSSKTHLTVVSIYVNPGKFSPSEDLSTYPSDFNGDINKLM